MLQNMVKKLQAEFGISKIKEDINAGTTSGIGAGNNEAAQRNDIEKEVISKLDRSVKMDEVDTVTFGLETDDGKVVKVYVNADQANDFERALSDKLGEIDDIEEALNELSKNYEIVDVEWPEDDTKSEDEEAEETTDGSEVMDSKVYKSKPKTAETEPTIEGLNTGEKFTMMVESDVGTIESRLNTASQLMVYHAILELGIPEVALNRNPYRAAIIKGIRDKAFQLNKNSQMKIALKMFVKRAIDYTGPEEEPEDKKPEHKEVEQKKPEHKPSIKKPENKTVDKKPEQKSSEQHNESLELMEGVTQDFWGSFSTIIKYVSPDSNLSDSFLNSSRLGQLMSRSSSSVASRVPQQLRARLNELTDELKIAIAKNGSINESATIDEIGDLLKKMLMIADPSDDSRLANVITSSSQWNQLMAKTKVHLSSKFSGTARNKLNMVKKALENAEILMTKKNKPETPQVSESKLVEEVQEWSFSKEGDDLIISCSLLKFTLDPEETEKLSKGISNRDAVVVKDVEENKKLVFSPRGVNGVFKQVGQTQTYSLTSKDIENLLTAIGEASTEETTDEEPTDKEESEVSVEKDDKSAK